MDANERFLKAAQKKLEKERSAALEWMDSKRSWGFSIYLPHYFRDRQEEDRILIAFRNEKGW